MKEKFTYIVKFSVTKKQLRKYGHFNWPELVINDKINEAVLQSANGIMCRGEGGPDFETCVFLELLHTKAITPNDFGKRIAELFG